MSTCHRTGVFVAGQVTAMTVNTNFHHDVFINRWNGRKTSRRLCAVLTYSCSVPKTTILFPRVEFPNVTICELTQLGRWATVYRTWYNNSFQSPRISGFSDSMFGAYALILFEC